MDDGRFFSRLTGAMLVVLAIVLIVAVPWTRARADEAPLDIKDVCTAAILQAEKLENIPERLLLAVAMAESGRWDKAAKQSYAWPWTVTNGGAGSFFKSREEALQQVSNLQAAGQSNIDVGCMQVNLRAHPRAFPDLITAFDPVSNAQYAAHFLHALFQETGDWSKAVAYYHSRTPERGSAYRDRVYAKLEKLSPSDPALAAARLPEAPFEPLSHDDTAAAQKVMRIWHWLREGQRSSLVAQANAAESRSVEPVAVAETRRLNGAGGIGVGRLLGRAALPIAVR
ncbi:Transglycosylase SLT domain-containing protein [Arboricoccus pini]|uniref:Transglycosylase SLT domain-containing protein n=1 Tax=Arboricoccus pini TaxID=1963835 RepID=A0A212Q221_9PROT|nr:lytic transglycosylase domain-containing protein [Arboricoccus pini]SNB53407.1 Transglycosylase SLT domain-containing protein [Arboricoccus pini]